MKDESGKLTSSGLAVLVVDALVDAEIVKKEDFCRAVEIAAEEIEVRKAAGDY
jgi:hypothetical protein